MNRKTTLILIPLIVILSTPILVNAKKPSSAWKKPPKAATFEITFLWDIAGGPFETVADIENWEPMTVKGKGSRRIWSIEHYEVTETFSYIEDVDINQNAPEPRFGEPDYPLDSSVCDFFDVNELITISWLEHHYSRDFDSWYVALNQTDGEGCNHELLVFDGVGVYDDTSDTWTVNFEEDYSFIEWWEWREEEGGVFHNVWKGYLTFTITIQRQTS